MFPESRIPKLLSFVLLTATLAIGSGGCAEPPRPRNAVLIVLDTLRADRLDARRNDAPIAPELAALGARGVVFEQAISNSSWTLPTLSALFSGQYLSARVQNEKLLISMVEELRDAGFSTVTVNEGGYFNRHYGMERGFSEFMQPGKKPSKRRRAKRAAADADELGIEQTFEAAQQWLRTRDATKRFFLVVHTYETHLPYVRGTFTEGVERGNLGERYDRVATGMIAEGTYVPTPAELDYVRALYDGGVASADAHVGMLLAALEELGLGKDTIVVVTSDHGEDLGDRVPVRPGFHGHTLYDELTRVPLIIHDPTQSFRVANVTAQVRTIDIMHTVFDLLGVATSVQGHGRSLVPMMLGDEADDRPAFSRQQTAAGTKRRNIYSLRTSEHKLLVHPDRPAAEQTEFYDLSADPGEQRPISDPDDEMRAAMRAELEALRRQLDADGAPVLKDNQKATPQLRDRLRALGYVE